VRAFLDGAGPAAIGAILGSAVPLAMSISQPWQYVVLAVALVAVFSRVNVVITLLVAAVAGILATSIGLPLPS
jgi:chromate transporter